MRWNPMGFAKGFIQTPLRGGIVMLVVSGPEGCVGDSIFALVVRSLALIGAAAAVLVGSLFRERL